MAKRIVRILPNGREVTRGVSRIRGILTAVIAEDEVDALRLELTDWLNAGETIASSALSNQSGVTLVKTNNPTSVDLTASGVTCNGEATLKVTTTSGRVKSLVLGFRTPDMATDEDAYRCVGW